MGSVERKSRVPALDRSALAPLASALADPVRLRVFARVVLAGEAGVDAADLRTAEPATEPATAKHLARLAQVGLVVLSLDGRAVARADAFGEALRPAGPAARDDVVLRRW